MAFVKYIQQARRGYCWLILQVSEKASGYKMKQGSYSYLFELILNQACKTEEVGKQIGCLAFKIYPTQVGSFFKPNN
jgi:hypothetical protein